MGGSALYVPRILMPSAMAVALTLGACGGGENTASAPTLAASSLTAAEVTTAPTGGASTDASTPSPGGSPASPLLAPRPFPADTRPDSGESGGPGPISVTHVDTARHEEGFDRVVFHIAGNGLAGWHVRYVESARSQGSGEPVEIAGSAVLEVTLTNVGYPADVEGPSYDGPKWIRPSGTEAIREIVNDNIYEGRHVFFVGAVRELPFRVFRLDDPQRVVLDVQHPR